MKQLVAPTSSAEPGYPSRRRFRTIAGIVLVVGALMTAAASFAILMGLTAVKPDGNVVLTAIAVNLIFVIALLIVIGREIYRIWSARRGGKAAARLHVRIVALFAIVASLPAILVAIVAAFTFEVGLDRWFNVRTQSIVSSSLEVAEAYVRDNALNLQAQTVSMAVDIDRARSLYSLDRGGFQTWFTEQAEGRGMLGASLLQADGETVLKADIKVDGARPDLPPVPADALQAAIGNPPVPITPGATDLVGVVLELKRLDGLYLYTLRSIDADVLSAVRLMEENRQEYGALEDNQANLRLAFVLLYLGLTLSLLLSAIWTGISVADKLVRPIRRLINAADDVSAGNLDVSVPVNTSEGDLGSLSGTFNTMVSEIKTQRDEILRTRDQIDERRRFSEAVLSGVSAGVIGVDGEDRVTIINNSARAMLLGNDTKALGKELKSVAPEIAAWLKSTAMGEKRHRQITLNRRGAERTLNLQVTDERAPGNARSRVVTIDDITDLVIAQRSNAWADVARRIAHEIKNPLTPIQLSAERIRRRYGKQITEDREIFDQCTETIIRQVGDIGRMVDEFSSFARMPTPEMETIDLRNVLKEALFLTEVSRGDIAFETDFGEEPLMGRFDSRMIGQAFGNLVKNASEAIDSLPDDEERKGRVKLRSRAADGQLVVDVMDNGIGLPKENRHRLLEPYMTTREKGTGLGLAIVRKIVEEHHGKLELHDAPAEFDGGRGAMVRAVFPRLTATSVASEETPAGKVANGI